MTGKRWFWLAVALQFLVLLGMIGTHSYTILTGEPVVLKVVPIDPWDAFRGEYVRLNYEISRLSPQQVIMTGAPYKRSQTIWVTLEKAEPFWRPVAVSTQRLAAGANQVVVRGRVTNYLDPKDYPPGEPKGDPNMPDGGTVWIEYGIEQFYIPEGEGHNLEQVDKLSVEALVDSFGRPALHRVFLEGKEIQWR